ncbi:MAG TPA: hypothetical protein VES67_14000 [Vicinamibacterales bacterium]|nr:hypothetical protein [Vicinamibacterales bacterium]
MKAREAERLDLRRQLARQDQAAGLARVDVASLERMLEVKLDDWKALLRRRAVQSRQVLKKLLVGPVLFTPRRDGKARYYEFRASIAIGRIVAGLVCANLVASPTGTDHILRADYRLMVPAA